MQSVSISLSYSNMFTKKMTRSRMCYVSFAIDWYENTLKYDYIFKYSPDHSQYIGNSSG